MQPMIDWADSNLGAMLVRWTLLLGLAWAAHGLLRSKDARWRLILWRGVFCFGILLPLVALVHFPQYEIPVAAIHKTAPVVMLNKPAAIPAAPETTGAPRPSSLQTIDTTETPSPPASTPIPFRRIPWGSSLMTLWALGSLMLAVRLIRSMDQLKRIQQRAAAAGPDILSISSAIQAHYRIKHPVPILVSRETETPFIYGIFNPVILIPEKLTRQLSLTEMTALLQHELAHQAHRDLVWCVGWRWMQAAFWFHPLIWNIPTAHNLACEEEADRAAADQLGSPAVYTEILAGLTLHILKVPAVETQLTANGAAEITRRLRRLGCHLRSWKRRHAAAAIALVASIVALSTGCKLTSVKEVPNASAADPNKVEVLVLDEAGKPLSGAQVKLLKYSLTSDTAEVCENTPVMTDHNGRAFVFSPPLVLNGLRPTPTNLQQKIEWVFRTSYNLHVSFPGYCAADEQLDQSLRRRTYQLVKPDVEIQGLDAIDNSKVDLQMCLIYDASGNLGPSEIDAHGRVISLLLVPGKHYVQVAGTSRDGKPLYSECVPFDLDPEKFLHLDLPLRPGIQVKGRLDDKVARPVKDGFVMARVLSEKYYEASWIYTHYADEFPAMGQKAFISPDGTFELSNLPPGKVEIYAFGDGFTSSTSKSNALQTVSFPVLLHRPVTQVVVDTKKTKPMGITVHNKDGKPQAGVELRYEFHSFFRSCMTSWPCERFNQPTWLRSDRLIFCAEPQLILHTDDKGQAVFKIVPPDLSGLLYGKSPSHWVGISNYSYNETSNQLDITLEE